MPGPGVHRWIVETLCDAEAREQIGPDGFLAPELWRKAVERTRLARFGTLPEWEGKVQVGRFMADGFLSSEPGHLVYESLRVLPLARALSAVAMPMSDRLRRSVEFDFRERPGGGGFIEARGELVVGPAVLLGFYQVIIEFIPGRHKVEVAETAPGLTRLEVSLLPG